MDFDSLIPDDAADLDPQSAAASKGAKPLVDIASNVWEQGGQNIHNALEKSKQGDLSGLQDMAIQNAISTLGVGAIKPSAKFIGYQELGEGQHLPLFNIIGEGHPMHGSTVSPTTLAKQGIEVPSIPTVEEWIASTSSKTTPKMADGGELDLSEGKPSDLKGDFIHFDDLPSDASKPITNLAPLSNTLSNGLSNNVVSDVPQSQPDFDSLVSDEDKYGSTSQQLATIGEGLAEGVAGPLAPAAEIGLGLTTPEDIRGRAATNPYLKGGSKLAGFAGSMLTGVGEAALLGKAGEAVVGAANLSSRIGKAALQGATEMGLLSAGDEVTKQIIQDPDASLQTAIADVGLSALLGAGGGAAFTAISPLWEGAFANKTGKLIEDFKGRIHQKLNNPEPLSSVAEELTEHYENIKNIADDVYGPTGLKARDIAKSMPEMHSGINLQVQELNEGLADSLSKMSEKPYNYPERLTSKLQDDVRNWEKTIYNPEATATDIFNATQDLKQTVQGYSKYGKFVAPHDEAYDFIKETKNIARTLRESLEDESVWKNAAVRQKEINKAFTEFKPALEAFEKKFTTQVPSESGSSRIIDPGKIQTYLNQVGKASGEVKQDVLKNFIDASEKYTETLAKSHQNLGLESPYIHSPLAATHETLKELSPGMKLADALIKSAKEGTGPGIGAAIGSAASHATGIPGGGLLGAILGEKVISPWIKSIFPMIAKSLFESGANSKAFKAAAEYGMTVIKGEAMLAKGAKNIFKASSEVLPVSAIPSLRQREQLIKLVSKYQENPEALTTAINGSLGGYMPNQALAMGKTLGSATQFLANNDKKDAKQAPLDSVPKESKAQQAARINALNIAEQPLIVLSKVKDGTITPSDINALQSMYPELYTKMQAKVSNELMEHINRGGIVPYKMRGSLSLFLGQPIDSSFFPGSIIAAQPLPQNASTPQAGVTKIKHSTKPLTNYAQQYQTAGQARQINKIKKG